MLHLLQLPEPQLLEETVCPAVQVGVFSFPFYHLANDKQDLDDAAGTLLCVFETTQTTGNTDSADLNIKSVTSTDEGVTWGDRSQVYTATAAEVEGTCSWISSFALCSLPRCTQ